MTRKFDSAVVTFLLVLIAAGIMLIAYSASLAEYKPNMPLPSDVNAWGEGESLLPDRDRFTEEFFKRKREASTGKWEIRHAGESLIAVSLCLGVFFFVTGILSDKVRPFRQRIIELKTPRHSLVILATGIAVMAYEIPWSYYYYPRLVSEGCCPIWADSLGPAIWPVMAATKFLLLTLTPLGFLMFLLGSKLPVPIFIWLRSRPFVSWGYTLLTAPFLLALVLLCVPYLFDNDALKIPQAMLGIWVVLCARAAAISRHIGTEPALSNLTHRDRPAATPLA